VVVLQELRCVCQALVVVVVVVGAVVAYLDCSLVESRVVNDVRKVSDTTKLRGNLKSLTYQVEMTMMITKCLPLSLYGQVNSFGYGNNGEDLL
jgi:hypothetical protein